MDPPSDLKHLFVDYLSRIQALEKKIEELQIQNRILQDKCASYSTEAYNAKKLHLVSEMKLLKVKILVDQMMPSNTADGS